MKFRSAVIAIVLGAALVTSVGWADGSLPMVEVVTPDGDATVGEEAAIEFRLTWSAGNEFWRVPAPELPADDDSTRYRWSASTTTLSDDAQVSRFVLAVTSQIPGAVDVPGLDFSIFADSGLTHSETAPLKKAPDKWEAGINVSSDPVQIRFRNPGVDPVLGFAALAVIAVLGLSVVLWLTRSRASNGAAGETVASTDPRELIHAARRARLDGDMHAFYQTLSTAATLVGTAGSKHLADQFGKRAQEIGYGGAYPSDDELDAALKSIERELVAHGGSR